MTDCPTEASTVEVEGELAGRAPVDGASVAPACAFLRSSCTLYARKSLVGSKLVLLSLSASGPSLAARSWSASTGSEEGITPPPQRLVLRPRGDAPPCPGCSVMTKRDYAVSQGAVLSDRREPLTTPGRSLVNAHIFSLGLANRLLRWR